MSQNNGVDQRDAKTGRFLSGNNGGGRKLGSRNKLTSEFIDDFYAKWQKDGRAILDEVAKTKPHEILRIAAMLLPKELSAELTTVNFFAQIDNVNTAYKLALDYINGKIADDEFRLVETNYGDT
jgi:hypothetical protein